MAIPATYTEVSIEGLPALAARMQAEGARFVQVLAVNTESGIDVQYTFMQDGCLNNFTIKGVRKEMPIPSITDRFIAAFVFENEIHDLFGLDIRNIAIDFKGHFYATAVKEPMTVISPEQKAAREKAAKAAAAKAARAKQAAAANASFVTSHPDAKQKVSGVAPSDSEEDIELRMAGTDPEKIARVRAAMARKAKLADMQPEKAEQVRGALANKAKLESQRATGQQTSEKQAELEAKLSQLDPERAAKVRAALDAKARKETAQAEHDEKVAVLEERLKNMDPERAAKVRAAFEAKQAAAAQGADSAAAATEKDGE